MSETKKFAVQILSTSNASDLGFRALADLARAAEGIDADSEDGGYRVIGGHMVQLLIHAYPTPTLQIRGTADADAGVSLPIAAGKYLHYRLETLGYETVKGNRYGKDSDFGPLAVDLLVPFGRVGVPNDVGGRGFDSAPGLSMAISAKPVAIDAQVTLRDGNRIEFTVLTPDVEAAVVLKALAWSYRHADKDIADLHSLFEIVNHHRTAIGVWKLDQEGLTATRRDAVAALDRLVSAIERRRVDQGLFGSSAARFTALVRRYTRSMDRV